MKTILINIFDSNIARNILRTNVFKELKKEKNFKLVVLVPHIKKEFYEDEFKHDNVIIDELPKVPASRSEIIANFIIRNSIPTHTVLQIMKEGLDGSGRLRLDKYIIACLAWLLGKYGSYRKLLRSIAPLFFQRGIYQGIFDKYKPDIIFSPTIYSTNDIRLIRCAKDNNIKVIGMIKSWDNLTSKDFVLIYPDYMIVHNEIIARELNYYADYPKDKIFISGIPQFDRYLEDNFIETQEQFFHKMKLNPEKKVILYSAMGSWLVPTEKAIIIMLADIINKGKLKYPAQLLVRLHPAYTSEDATLKNIPNIIIDRPGSFRSTTSSTVLRSGWEFHEDDTKHLAATVKYADVAINEGSTMSIECACFDTPLININFDANSSKVPYWRSVKRLFKREHYIPIIETGGLKLPNNEEELIRAINDYLADHELDKTGRDQIVKEQCFKFDGRSGERIANFIINTLLNEKK